MNRLAILGFYNVGSTDPGGGLAESIPLCDARLLGSARALLQEAIKYRWLPDDIIARIDKELSAPTPYPPGFVGRNAE